MLASPGPLSRVNRVRAVQARARSGQRPRPPRPRTPIREAHQGVDDGARVPQPARRSPAVAAGVPTTKDVLGYYVGTPKKLTYTADICRYYRALEGKTPRVKVTNIGTTDEGREILMVFVGSEDSIANLESLSQVSGAARRPARPDGRAGAATSSPAPSRCT